MFGSRPLRAWSLTLDAWSLKLGAWSLTLGAWSLECGVWSLTLDDNVRGHSFVAAERSRCNIVCRGIDKGSLCMVSGSSTQGDSKVTCALSTLYPATSFEHRL